MFLFDDILLITKVKKGYRKVELICYTYTCFFQGYKCVYVQHHIVCWKLE